MCLAAGALLTPPDLSRNHAEREGEGRERGRKREGNGEEERKRDRERRSIEGICLHQRGLTPMLQMSLYYLLTYLELLREKQEIQPALR